jgi:hypothetical protein
MKLLASVSGFSKPGEAEEDRRPPHPRLPLGEDDEIGPVTDQGLKTLFNRVLELHRQQTEHPGDEYYRGQCTRLVIEPVFVRPKATMQKHCRDHCSGETREHSQMAGCCAQRKPLALPKD